MAGCCIYADLCGSSCVCVERGGGLAGTGAVAVSRTFDVVGRLRLKLRAGVVTHGLSLDGAMTNGRINPPWCYNHSHASIHARHGKAHVHGISVRDYF